MGQQSSKPGTSEAQHPAWLLLSAAPCARRTCSYLAGEKALTDVSLLLPEGEKDPGALCTLCLLARALHAVVNCAVPPRTRDPRDALQCLAGFWLALQGSSARLHAGFAALGRHIASLQYAAIPGFNGIPGAGYATASGIISPSEAPQSGAGAVSPCFALLCAVMRWRSPAVALLASPSLSRRICQPESNAFMPGSPRPLRIPAGPAAFEVPLKSRKRQAEAIRRYWAAAPLLPRVAASKKRVLYIT